MCTVSWVHESGGYQLLCNRDEKRTRLSAAPPTVIVRDGVRYIAPRDGDHGGTWIATNERGMTLCLLNGLPRTGVGVAEKSRGLFIPELIAAGSLWEMSERVWNGDLSCYAPFVLVGLEPGSPATLIEWDGTEKSIVPYAEPFMPVTSSSFDPEGVQRARKLEFARLRAGAQRVDVDLLFAFHENHGAQADAYSTCMHREDAETVSFSWVRVDEEQVEFHYAPGSPCQWTEPERSVLERAA